LVLEVGKAGEKGFGALHILEKREINGLEIPQISKLIYETITNPIEILPSKRLNTIYLVKNTNQPTK